MAIGDANKYLGMKFKGEIPQDLYLDSFLGKEGMSRLFSFELLLYSENLDYKPTDFLNEEISFCVNQLDSEQWYHGVIQRFQYGSRISAGMAEYRVTVVPQMWKLTRNRKYKIFTEMKTSDIISAILADNGISGSKIATTKTKHEKCTQYGESDFHFISRLMEQEGLFYYFEHAKDSHKLIVEKAANWQAGDTISPEADQLYSVKPQYELRGHEKKVMAYDYVNDVKLIEKKSPSKDADVKKHKAGELHEYTGISNSDVLNPYADARMATEESQYAKASFITFNSSIRMGNAIECNEFPGLQASEKYELIDSKWIPTELETHAFEKNRITNIGFQDTPRKEVELFIREMSSGVKELDRVFGDLECDSPHILKAEDQENVCNGNARTLTSFFNRISCLREKASLSPPCITTKPVISGVQTARVVECEDPEGMGRIRVEFFWGDGEASCFARIAQPIAGDTWGFMSTPRIGQDVVVAFEQGDPDRPLIVGGVYNGKNKPSYGGETNDWNKTYFRDAIGNEILFDEEEPLLFLNAVEYHKREVGKDMESIIHGDKKETIDGNFNGNVQGDLSLEVQGNEKLEVTGNRTTSITGNQTLEAMEIKITANKTIMLQAGPSSIEIGPSGVTIKGPIIQLN